jgi:hypothetical protein
LFVPLVVFWQDMRNPLRRHYGQGDLHFVAFRCYRRRPLLGGSTRTD